LPGALTGRCFRPAVNVHPLAAEVGPDGELEPLQKTIITIAITGGIRKVYSGI
jgi:hypothetical protein